MRLCRKKYCGAGISDALSHLFLKRLKWSGFYTKWSGFSWSLHYLLRESSYSVANPTHVKPDSVEDHLSINFH